MVLNYTDQLFMQAIMASRALTEQNTLELYNKCLTRTKGDKARLLPDAVALANKINTINDELTTIGFELKTVFSPWEGAKFWGMCNLLEDGAVSQSNTWLRKELLFFFKLIEALRDSDGTMELVETHDMAHEDYSMTIADGASLVQRFNQQKWIKINKQGGRATVSFGPRALLELPSIRTWLLQKNREGALDVAKPETITEEEQSQRPFTPSTRDHEEEEEEAEEEEEEEEAPTRRRRSSRRLVRLVDKQEDQ